jgi:hypothetical protein
MRRRPRQPRAQLALDLRRETTAIRIAPDTSALLQALADLLLGALGEEVETPADTNQDQGGADDSEDHV